MGAPVPPASKSQPASARPDDPHESVTIAPPAANLEELLREASGEHSPQEPGDQHLRAALDAGARAGVSLNGLSNLIAELSGSVLSAKQANAQLVHELSTLRALLESANQQRLGLGHQLAELQRELAASREDAELQRQTLIEQHDEFLAALMQEHEEALLTRGGQADRVHVNGDASQLAQQLAVAQRARQHAEAECERAREAVAKAQAQRDEAHARADKRERERDELRAEASLLRARLGIHRDASTSPPPPVTSCRPPSFHPPPALSLDASELDATLHPRPAAPRFPSLKPRQALPPNERVPYGAGSAQPTPAPSAAVATAFPRESTRPGVGGPKLTEPPLPPSFGPPPTGWTPPPPRPTEEPPHSASPRPRIISAASSPSMPSVRPALKQKPHASTRPLIDYSLGEDGVKSEMLEGARLSSKPPIK